MPSCCLSNQADCVPHRVLTHLSHPPTTPLHLSSYTEPFEHWFYIHEWAPLIIFFGTYLGIVRNKRIPHVARYHIMMVRTSHPPPSPYMLPLLCSLLPFPPLPSSLHADMRTCTLHAL